MSSRPKLNGTECGCSITIAARCTYCGSERLTLTETPDRLEPVISYRHCRCGRVYSDHDHGGGCLAGGFYGQHWTPGAES